MKKAGVCLVVIMMMMIIIIPAIILWAACMIIILIPAMIIILYMPLYGDHQIVKYNVFFFSYLITVWTHEVI